MILVDIQLGRLNQSIYIVDDKTQQLKTKCESEMPQLVNNIVSLAHGGNEKVVRIQNGPVNYSVELQQEIQRQYAILYGRDNPITVEIGPIKE